MAKNRKPAGQPEGEEHRTQRDDTGEFQQTENTSNYDLDDDALDKQEEKQDQEDEEELEYDEDLDDNSEAEIDEENP